MSPRAWLALVGAVGFATASGCFSPELTPGLPCATDRDPPCPEGQVCDLAAGTCVPDSSLDTWRDDTATDFGDPSAVFEDAAVEANGAVGPTPYLVEGIAIFGIDAMLIGDGNEGSVAWDVIANAPTTGRGFVRRELELDFGGGAPGTGLPDLDGVTIRIEGEIYLELGEAELELDCDDRCFFDLGDPATGGFDRVAATDQGPPGYGTITVGREGWYPFHGAVEGDENGGLWYEVSLDEGEGFSIVEGDRIRARIDDASGLALDGFDDAYMHGPTGTTLATGIAERQDFGTSGFPDDVGALGNAAWSVRWSGQVLVDVAGSYAFELDSRGGHRIWLDGRLLADTDDFEPAMVTTTAPMDLDAGWHDLVLDMMKSSDSSTPSYFEITVAQGPALVGSFFPLDHQRPVTGRTARWQTAGSGSTVAIPDMGQANKSVFLDLPPGVTDASFVDYEYAFTHPLQSTVSIALDPPGGAPFTLIAAGALTGTGAYDARFRLDGVQGNGTWNLIASDSTADVMTGSITSARISATYTGLTAPFPTFARYTSRVRDLGAVVAYSGVRWQARQTATGQVTVAVRSCDDATCAGVAWTPVPSSGAAAGIAPRPFVQYQVEITSDGDVPTALDWIEIDYRL